MEEFDNWLYSKLRDLNTDSDVFGPYIKSIVESDEDHDEKIEGLDGLLIELQGTCDAEKLRNEILDRWNKATSTNNSASSTLSNGKGGDQGVDGIISTLEKVTTGQLKSEPNKNENVGSHLDNQIENIFRLSDLDTTNTAQQSSTSKTKRKDEELGADSALRAAILSKYRGSDDSSEEDEGNTKPKPKSEPFDGLQKNDNAEKVMAEQRERKEKASLEHTKKKERDKEDRAKQKQAAVDRKEKAKKKAQKTERKR